MPRRQQTDKSADVATIVATLSAEVAELKRLLARNSTRISQLEREVAGKPDGSALVAQKALGSSSSFGSAGSSPSPTGARSGIADKIASLGVAGAARPAARSSGAAAPVGYVSGPYAQLEAAWWTCGFARLSQPFQNALQTA